MDIIKKEMTCTDCGDVWFFRFSRLGQEDEYICGCWDHYVATLKNESDVTVKRIPFPSGFPVMETIKRFCHKIKCAYFTRK